MVLAALHRRSWLYRVIYSYKLFTSFFAFHFIVSESIYLFMYFIIIVILRSEIFSHSSSSFNSMDKIYIRSMRHYECRMWNVPFCRIATIVPCKITHTFKTMTMCIREAMNEQRHKVEEKKAKIRWWGALVRWRLLSSPSSSSLPLVTRRLSVFILFYSRFCVFFSVIICKYIFQMRTHPL